MRIHEDPHPGQEYIYMKKYYVVKGSKNIPYLLYVGTKAFLKFCKSDLFIYTYLSCSWIRVRILNKDPDPGEPHQCGSTSTTLLRDNRSMNPPNLDPNPGI
jgi:hypothetical protein